MKEGGGGEMTDVDLDLDLESKEATQLSVRQSVRTNSSRWERDRFLAKWYDMIQYDVMWHERRGVGWEEFVYKRQEQILWRGE